MLQVSCGDSDSKEKKSGSDITPVSDRDVQDDDKNAQDTEQPNNSQVDEDTEEPTDRDTVPVAQTDPVECTTTSDCRKEERSRGFLCIDFLCQPCETNEECMEESAYGQYGLCRRGRCETFPGCLTEGCGSGKICDSETRECRDKKRCSECAEHQKCEAKPDVEDDFCLEECEENHLWNSVTGKCDFIKNNCQPGKMNSIRDSCATTHRKCLETEEGAECGKCMEGYKEENGTCVLIKTCENINCASRNRICIPNGADDAECGRCFGEYRESFALTNSDFDDDDTTATGWTVITGAQDQIRKEQLHDFSNYLLLDPSSEEASAGQDLTPFESGTELSVRLSTRETSGDFNTRAKISIKITMDDSGTSVETTLYANEISSYDGVVDKIFDITNYSGISKVILSVESGGTPVAVDWIRIYTTKENAGTCSPLKGTSCDPDPAQGSILKNCRKEHRKCDQIDSSTARCGECDPGFVEINSQCFPKINCGMLDCGKRHLECVELPNAHCGACLEGFVKNATSGECVCPEGKIFDRLKKVCEGQEKCATANCSSDEFCIEGTATTHALCSRCEAGSAWNGRECIKCGTCLKDGETGRVYIKTSEQGHCVCETAEGYYHSSTPPMGTRKCDADGDGWISDDARESMNEIEESADRVNARCDLRFIDRIVLINEMREEKIIRVSDLELGNRIALYEPVSRDVETELLNDTIYADMSHYAPKYGTNGLLLTAAELNPFTKGCATNTNPENIKAREADYNANGIFDVDEKGWKASEGSNADKFFAMFSYYMELHRGWYENNGENSGRYIIMEKSRSEFAQEGFSVALNYGEEEKNSYWRECLRWRDSDYEDEEKTSPYGLDFANYSDRSICSPGTPGSWCGMHHHSQFKCKVFSDSTEDGKPQYVEDINSKDFILNECESTATLFENGNSMLDNPKTRKLTCSKVTKEKAMEKKTAVWTAATYRSNFNEGEYNYQRGCISECAEKPNLPASMQCNVSAECRDFTNESKIPDYGKIYCYKPLDTIEIYTNTTYQMGTPEDQGTYKEEETSDEDLPDGLPDGEVSDDDVVAQDENFTWKKEDEKPHTVTLTYHYEITATEITGDQFMEIMDYNPSKFGCSNAVCPVESVTFYDALAFANKKSEEDQLTSCYEFEDTTCADGKSDYTVYCNGQGGIQSAIIKTAPNLVKIQDCDGYRLPTEAEWEYAAGSGYEITPYILEEKPFFIGNITAFNCEEDPSLMQIGWYCGNSSSEGILRPQPVAMKRATDWGIFDMNGNVAEWVWDAYSKNLTSGVDPVISEGNERVIRGGSYDSKSQECRSSSREKADPGMRSDSIGFRLVKTIH